MTVGGLPGNARSAAIALAREMIGALGSRLHALYLYGAVTFPESEGTGDLDYHAIMSVRSLVRAGTGRRNPGRCYPTCPRR